MLWGGGGMQGGGECRVMRTPLGAACLQPVSCRHPRHGCCQCGYSCSPYCAHATLADAGCLLLPACCCPQPLYAPIPIPPALLAVTEGCGEDIFAFVQADLRSRYAPGPAAEHVEALP